MALKYNAPPSPYALFARKPQLLIMQSEMLLLKIMAPPLSANPSLNMILFKTTFFVAFILDILEKPEASIANPLPSMVIAFVIFIPSLEKLPSLT